MDLSVPISKLYSSASNARRTKRLIDIDVLAAQIASQGLLQRLLVRAVPGDRYEIVDGGRRHAAIKLLIRSDGWAKSDPVPVKVLADDQQDLEVSLAANLGRVDMHPADTFEAFQRLAEQEGATPELIGLRFGYAAATVRGFLKLANCSPRLMKAFRRDEVTIEQMKALSLTDDHKRQDAAFFGVPEHFRSPRELRRRVAEGKIEGADRFVRFVGLSAYEAAGGTCTRDLFGSADDVFIDDPGLLDRLVSEKLEAEAALLHAEGWKWVDIVPDVSRAPVHELARVDPHAHGFAADSPTARLYAGVILGVDREGQLKCVTGLLKPDDAKALAKARQAPARRPEPNGSGTASPATGISAPVVEELTAIRTLALRAELAARPDLALAAIVHDLALGLFHSFMESGRRLTEVRAEIVRVEERIANHASNEAAQSIAARIERWRGEIPEKAADLWSWLASQEQGVLLELLALVVAVNVNAIRFRHEKQTPSRVASADRLARSLDLDMTKWWRPDAEFFGRLTKSAILSAIAEGTSPETARALDHAKKAELATVAARKLAETQWLPTALRTPEAPQADGADEDADADDFGDRGDELAADESDGAEQAHMT